MGVPGSGPVVFGSFTFDGRDAGSTLILPRVVVGRRDGQTWLTVVGDEADPLPAVPPPRPVGALRWRPGTLSEAEWCAVVSQAVDRIHTTGLAKVVLARDLVAEADHPIDVRTPLQYGRRLPTATSPVGTDRATRTVMLHRHPPAGAGDRAAGATADDDAVLAKTLLTSAKDVEEHAYAVESLRESLAPFYELRPATPNCCVLPRSIWSPRCGPYPRKDGDLPVLRLHPTAAVGGTDPGSDGRHRRIEERLPPGRGWIDARGAGMGIALRCAQITAAGPPSLGQGSSPTLTCGGAAETVVKSRGARRLTDGGSGEAPRSGAPGLNQPRRRARQRRARRRFRTCWLTEPSSSSVNPRLPRPDDQSASAPSSVLSRMLRFYYRTDPP